MIRYFDTEAAYLAAVQDTESRVSLVGESNACKFDGRNVVVGIDSATTGSIAYLDDKKAIHFVAASTFNKTAFPAGYEIFGVVVIGVDHDAFRGDVTVMNKEFKPLAMFERAYLSLTGFTLDGTEHTGTISIREASDSWIKAHDYVIAYNADNVASFVAQLNEVFRTKDAFKTQDWVATADTDGNVMLNYSLKSVLQVAYNGAEKGFSAHDVTTSGLIGASGILKINDNKDDDGTISNLNRAIAFFHDDTSDVNYNPSTDVKTTKIRFPICLPGYLGTSKHQSDHCAYLRSIYGEGEKGWLKFMKSFLPVLPSEYGAMTRNKDFEMYNTYSPVTIKYTGQDGIEKHASPAASYVANIAYDNELLAKGKWFVGDLQRNVSIIAPLKYPTMNDRNADKTNAALYAIDASPLRNDIIVTSFIITNNRNSRFVVSDKGIIDYFGINNPFQVIPLVLLPRA